MPSGKQWTNYILAQDTLQRGIIPDMNNPRKTMEFHSPDGKVMVINMPVIDIPESAVTEQNSTAPKRKRATKKKIAEQGMASLFRDWTN